MPPEPFTRGEPYFDDGNIILIADDNIAFRLHRGFLARHSETFENLFGIPALPTTDGAEFWDGCTIVRMYDHPQELSDLIKALYDGVTVTFQNRDMEDFFYLSSILKLSTKYCIANLRVKAIRHLASIWATTLAGHDALVKQALAIPAATRRITYPYVHPLHVLNLARQTHVDVIIPSVTYFLSLYPLEDLLRADHPKLLAGSAHPGRPSTELAAIDLKNYTLLLQHRLHALIFFTRHFVGDRRPSENCLNKMTSASPNSSQSGLSNASNKCSRTLAKLSTRLAKAWQLRTGPFHFMKQTAEDLMQEDPNAFCTECKKKFAEDADIVREKVWNDIPTTIGMPEWKVLEKQLETG